LPLDSATSHRDYAQVKISAAGGMRSPLLRPLSVSSTARISPVYERYVEPRLPRLAGSTQPRPSDSSLVRFSARKTAPMVPARRAASAVRIPRVRAAVLGDRIRGTGSEHRGYGAFRHAGIRAHAGCGGIAPSRIEPPGAACFLSSQRPLGIEASQRTGSPRGLSRSFGFRRTVRPSAVCAGPLKARVVMASLASPALRFRYLRKTGNGPAAPRAMSGRIVTRELACLSFLARVSIAGIKWPGAVRMGRRRPDLGYAPAVRGWGPLWNVSGLAGFPHPRRSLAAPERGMATPCVVALPLAPVRSNGAHHVALAPFAPQNSPFGYKEYQ
jgi:hypothetical protein